MQGNLYNTRINNENVQMDAQNKGWLNGLVGVMIFAGSMPATRIAVTGFNPEFLTGARAVIAGLFALLILVVFKQRMPQLKDFIPLCITALGVVLGFPLFTALALQEISAARALVFVALLPLSTAIFGVFRAAERPSLAFWLFALIGSMLVMGFMIQDDQGQIFSRADLYMIVAILLCGLGYAEGGQLSKSLGGWQVICWALVIALPFMFVLSYYSLPQSLTNVSISAYLGLIYVAVFSMLLGFFFWYKGLALGGIAKVGQIQLIQPFLGLMLSAIFLGESVSLAMVVVSIAVMLCVMMAKRFA